MKFAGGGRCNGKLCGAISQLGSFTIEDQGSNEARRTREGAQSLEGRAIGLVSCQKIQAEERSRATKHQTSCAILIQSFGRGRPYFPRTPIGRKINEPSSPHHLQLIAYENWGETEIFAHPYIRSRRPMLDVSISTKSYGFTKPCGFSCSCITTYADRYVGSQDAIVSTRSTAGWVDGRRELENGDR
jgi:hypothetical protein